MHCLVQPERRPSLASLSPLTLQAQTLRPKGAWQPEKLPNRLSGRRCRGRAGPAPQPASNHSVTYLQQGDRRGSRCPRSQGSRVACRGSWPGAPECRAVDDPGARAQATESHAPGAAVGRVETPELRSANWTYGWGCSWKWGWIRSEYPSRGGTDARGARLGSRDRLGVATTSLQLPLVSWLPAC